eukprot:scaffold5589_cov115-Isochrysis_galbana.AAC.5
MPPALLLIPTALNCITATAKHIHSSASASLPRLTAAATMAPGHLALRRNGTLDGSHTATQHTHTTRAVTSRTWCGWQAAAVRSTSRRLIGGWWMAVIDCWRALTESALDYWNNRRSASSL